MALTGQSIARGIHLNGSDHGTCNVPGHWSTSNLGQIDPAKYMYRLILVIVVSSGHVQVLSVVIATFREHVLEFLELLELKPTFVFLPN